MGEIDSPRGVSQAFGVVANFEATAAPRRRLIVSADDFGMSPGINAGIARAHSDGILTNAGLMVNGSAFDEAVELARAHPSLAVGLHLVLVQGRSTLPHKAIPDLVDCSGQFPTNPIAAGLRYYFHTATRRQVQLEVRAQIEKFLATGLPLSHVDGHLNIHMHPVVMPILLDLAEEFGIRALRLSRDPLLPALRFDRRDLGRKLFEATAFHSLASLAAPGVNVRAIRCTDRVYGLHQSGRITEDYLLYTIDTLPPGVSEIYCHAGESDAEARRWRPPDYCGEAELSGLTSGRVRDALERREIELTSYRRLAQQ